MSRSTSDNLQARDVPGRFTGKAALVSGAGSGIGRAVARRLLREGGNVVFFGRTPGKLEEAMGDAPTDRARCVAGSHEKPEDSLRAVATANDAFGRLDFLVNNAGEFLQATTELTSPENWSRILDSNLTGPFVLTRAALPLLRKARGAVVNVASTLGIQPIAGVAAYAAAKAGLIQWTRALALEEAPHGVRANVVCPGIVDTPIHTQRSELDTSQFLEGAAKLHPLGRVGKPEEVAATILFLLSEESGWTTGASLSVDGGIVLT